MSGFDIVYDRFGIQCREVLKATGSALEDELWLFNTGSERPLRYKDTVNTRKTVSTLEPDAEFGSNIVPASVSGKSTSLSNTLNSLFVLRDIVMMTSLFQDSVCDHKRKIFFSTLSSICTVSDLILRKVRGFLMVISLDCTKLELMAEENVSKSPPVKFKGKVGSCSRKKKGKTRNTKKLNPVEEGCMDVRDKSLMVTSCPLLVEGFTGVLFHTQCLLRRVAFYFYLFLFCQDVDCALAHKEKAESVESKKTPDVPQRKDMYNDKSLFKVEMAPLVV